MAKKEMDTRPSVKVVTDNRFIVANGLSNLKLKERKLLYLAISQVKKNDKELYEYRISAKDFADLMGIVPDNVYREAKEICKAIRPAGITCDTSRDGKNETIEYSLFSFIKYGEDSDIVFRLNQDMAEFLLDLKKNFTQPLLQDFLKMNSPYSMAIWHLFQREMHSRKPSCSSDDEIVFELSLEELRKVTGTEDKLNKLSHFKERILDKALREIKENCGVVVTYENITVKRAVKGFRFTAKNEVQYNTSGLSPEFKARVEAKAQELREQTGTCQY